MSQYFIEGGGGGGSGVLQLTGDSGTATPDGSGNINVLARNNSSAIFTGSSHTLGMSLVDGNNNFIAQGYNSTTTGRGNFFANPYGNFPTNCNNTILIGTMIVGAQYNSGNDDNIYLGNFASGYITTQTNNIAIGSEALTNGSTNPLGVTKSNNVAIGSNALSNAINSGTISTNYNLALGYAAGQSSHGVGNSNIYLQSPGNDGESNLIRIGTQGNGNAQQNACFVAGIGTQANNADGSVVVVNTSTGQLTQAAGIQTAPQSSSTTTGLFGNSLTSGTAKQNTLGYNILLNITFSVTAATGATIVMGVGSASTVSTNAVTPTFSITGDFSFCAIVPNNYYVLVNTTGTITVASITVQACAL